MNIIREPYAPGEHLYDFQESVRFLRSVGRGENPSTLRFYSPAPNVAFGRRDELNPYFSAAKQAAHDAGYVAAVRPVGGHAAAYHGGCLVVDHFQAAVDAVSGNMDRFDIFARMYVRVLESLGVHAGVGEIPGEYCPGEYSVYARTDAGARVKIVGTAQRVVSGAWWFSAGIVVDNSAPLRQVTTDVYRELGLTLNPQTVGAITDINPLVAVEDVEDAVLGALAEMGFC